MKRCELCSHFARMYCQSDNASLCYDCDQNVHSANFLVAKHSRTLLCHKCQSPTPWNASGLSLGRTASVCVDCLCLEENPSRRRVFQEAETSHRGNDVVEENYVEEEDGETDDEESESSEDESDADEDAENQVVPLSSVASLPTTGSGCSSSEELSSSDGFRSASKRERLNSEDDSPCSSERSNSKRRTENDDVISLGCLRPY